MDKVWSTNLRMEAGFLVKQVRSEMLQTGCTICQFSRRKVLPQDSSLPSTTWPQRSKSLWAISKSRLNVSPNRTSKSSSLRLRMSFSIIESRRTTILISQRVDDPQDSVKTTPNRSLNQNQSPAHTAAHPVNVHTQDPHITWSHAVTRVDQAVIIEGISTMICPISILLTWSMVSK